MTKDHLLARLAQLHTERATLIEQANRRLAQLNGAELEIRFWLAELAKAEPTKEVTDGE